MKVHISWLDQHGYFVHYSTMNHLPSARRTAENRARSTGKRHRITDDNGSLLDLFD